MTVILSERSESKDLHLAAKPPLQPWPACPTSPPVAPAVSPLRQPFLLSACFQNALHFPQFSYLPLPLRRPTPFGPASGANADATPLSHPEGQSHRQTPPPPLPNPQPSPSAGTSAPSSRPHWRPQPPRETPRQSSAPAVSSLPSDADRPPPPQPSASPLPTAASPSKTPSTSTSTHRRCS